MDAPILYEVGVVTNDHFQDGPCGDRKRPFFEIVWAMFLDFAT